MQPRGLRYLGEHGRLMPRLWLGIASKSTGEEVLRPFFGYRWRSKVYKTEAGETHRRYKERPGGLQGS